MLCSWYWRWRVTHCSWYAVVAGWPSTLPVLIYRLVASRRRHECGRLASDQKGRAIPRKLWNLFNGDLLEFFPLHYEPIAKAMNVSKRQQRRTEFIDRNRERIDRLVEKYGTSEEIQKEIGLLEKKSGEGQLGARGISELEVLHSQYRVLREFERNGGKTTEEGDHSADSRGDDKQREEENGGIKVLSLKEKSVFWDAELNPLGRQPVNEVKLNYGFRGEYQVPFTSNVGKLEAEQMSYPTREKPRFYRVDDNKTVYGNV